jgi:hypothetical protein
LPELNNRVVLFLCLSLDNSRVPKILKKVRVLGARQHGRFADLGVLWRRGVNPGALGNFSFGVSKHQVGLKAWRGKILRRIRN